LPKCSDTNPDGHVVVFYSEATNLVANTVPAATFQAYRVGVP